MLFIFFHFRPIPRWTKKSATIFIIINIFCDSLILDQTTNNQTDLHNNLLSLYPPLLFLFFIRVFRFRHAPLFRLGGPIFYQYVRRKGRKESEGERERVKERDGEGERERERALDTDMTSTMKLGLSRAAFMKKNSHRFSSSSSSFIRTENSYALFFFVPRPPH